MMDEDVRNFLERMAAEEPVPFLDAEPLTRRAQRRAGRTVIVGALGVAAAIAVLFAGAFQLREASPNLPATDPTPTPTPSGPILRSAGEILWYPFNEGDLLAVDPATGDARVLVEELGYLDDARWSADGRWVAFVTNASLWVVDAELEPRKVMDIPGTGRRSWDWSSTGALLAVQQNSMLHIIDPASGLVTDLASTAGITSTLAWSPDNTRIVFGDETRSIHSVDVDTGEVSPVVELAGYVETIYAFSWSPDGSRLAVLVEGTGAAQLLVMDTGGSNIRIVAAGELTTADWSPDASRIVFAEEHGLATASGEIRIWVAPADGSTASLVASYGNRGCCLWGDPVWSPDGSQIAFSEEPNRAHVVSADGSSDVEDIDDLTYASWSGGSFCWNCLP